MVLVASTDLLVGFMYIPLSCIRIRSFSCHLFFIMASSKHNPIASFSGAKIVASSILAPSNVGSCNCTVGIQDALCMPNEHCKVIEVILEIWPLHLWRGILDWQKVVGFMFCSLLSILYSITSTTS
jgi:hypothetical protein